MRNENDSGKLYLAEFFGLWAKHSILTLIFLVLPATQVFAQKKTSSTSPCVDMGGTAKSISLSWANQNYQPCRQAISSLRAASLFALGMNLDESPWNVNADFRLQNWLMKIGDSPAWKAKFDDGLTIKDATDYLVESELVNDHSDDYRTTFVNGIYDRVYGKSPTKAESDAYVAQIKAKKTWFSPIFLAEKDKLNKNPAQREEMIVRAFLNVLKRRPTADEVSYWKPRTEIYREIAAKIKK